MHQVGCLEMIVVERSHWNQKYLETKEFDFRFSKTGYRATRQHAASTINPTVSSISAATSLPAVENWGFQMTWAAYEVETLLRWFFGPIPLLSPLWN